MSDWIDARDAVPDTGRRVLVTTHRRDNDRYDVMIGHYDRTHWVKPEKMSVVIGWQEMPEPYHRKGEA